MRLIGPPEADGEYVALRDGDSGEEIVHLHDYERLYRVPGLYEHVVQELLQCRSPQVAVDGLAYALARLGIDPAGIVLLDLGAGTGIVGELVRAAGVPVVIGLDALERPRRHHPTGLVSAGAMGGGTHMPPAALVNALGLLPADAPVVFTIDERWMNTDAPVDSTRPRPS